MISTDNPLNLFPHSLHTHSKSSMSLRIFILNSSLTPVFLPSILYILFLSIFHFTKPYLSIFHFTKQNPTAPRPTLSLKPGFGLEPKILSLCRRLHLPLCHPGINLLILLLFNFILYIDICSHITI